MSNSSHNKFLQPKLFTKDKQKKYHNCKYTNLNSIHYQFRMNEEDVNEITDSSLLIPIKSTSANKQTITHWYDKASNMFKKQSNNHNPIIDESEKNTKHWFIKEHSSNPLEDLPSPSVQTNYDQPQLDSTLKRSKSWFFRNKPDSTVKITDPSSPTLNILSCDSLDPDDPQNENDLYLQLQQLKINDNIPIVLGTYNGGAIYKNYFDESILFQFKIEQYNIFDQFDELLYHVWNVWTWDHKEKKLTDLLESKSDLTRFFKRNTHAKVLLMRSNLVPDYQSFRNGYLIKIIFQHKKKINVDKVFYKCSESILLERISFDKSVKITVVGITFEKKIDYNQMLLWIHPILNMSFDISNQTVLLLNSMKLDIKFNSVTLIDINTNSKQKIDIAKLN